MTRHRGKHHLIVETQQNTRATAFVAHRQASLSPTAFPNRACADFDVADILDLQGEKAMKCGDLNNPAGIQYCYGTGKPCGRPVKPGTFRCHIHGQVVPMLKHKAQNTLALLRFPAIEGVYRTFERLNELMDQFDSPTCAACGFPALSPHDSGRITRVCLALLKTCQEILDRTGMGPQSTFEITQSDGNFDMQRMTNDERDRIMILLAELKTLKVAVRTRMLNEPAPMTPTELADHVIM